MRILAIDVGTGTQDIMIYDTEKEGLYYGLQKRLFLYRMRTRGGMTTDDFTEIVKILQIL